MKRRQPKHHKHSPIPVEGKKQRRRATPYSRQAKRRGTKRIIASKQREVEDAQRRGRFPEREPGVELVSLNEIRRREKIQRMNALVEKPTAELERLISNSKLTLKSARLTAGHKRIIKLAENKSVLSVQTDILRALDEAKEHRPGTYLQEVKVAFEGFLYSANEALGKRDISKANDLLGHLLELNAGRRHPVPAAVGGLAAKMARTVSRSVAINKAIGLIELSGSHSPVARRDVLGRGEGRAAVNLGFVGELRDIEPLGIIGQECWEAALEGRCAHSIQRILARDGLLKFIGANKAELARFGIDFRKTSNRTFAERTFPLLDDLGFGHVMRRTGGPTGISAMSWDPVGSTIGERKLAKIKELGLDRYLKETDIILSVDVVSDPEYFLVKAARAYLMGTGIIQRGKPGWFKLTPRGVQFVKFLISATGPQVALTASKPALRPPKKK